MFNKKPLIKWLMISAVLAVIYSAIVSMEMPPRESFSSSLSKIIAEDQKVNSPEKVSFTEAQAGEKRLKELKEKYPDPKDLFEQVKDNYKIELVAGGVEWNHQMSSDWEFNEELRKGRSDLFYANEQNVIDASLSSINVEKPMFRLKALLSQKSYLPIKGKWEIIFFH